ncbi:cytochrome-c oxidase, cbb3-type subunit II, partial [Roseovarius sp. D0-M9]
DSAGVDGVLDRYGEDVAVRAFDGDPSKLTELDAVVAYLQSLGTLTDAAHAIPEEVTQ